MKVGTFDIPNHRIHYCIELTRRIYDKFKSDAAPDDLTVANLLDHKIASGPFQEKLSCLRRYGLVEKRGIKVTPLGIDLVYPPSEEAKVEAFKTAIQNIPLWAELYRKFGVELPKENFWVDLRQITGLDVPDSQKNAEFVRKEYMEDVKYLNIVERLIPPSDAKIIQARGNEAGDRTSTMDTAQSVQCVTPGLSGLSKSESPYLYDPDLPAPIVITNLKTYKAAKIFWEGIEAEWEPKVKEAEQGIKEKSSEQKPIPPVKE